MISAPEALDRLIEGNQRYLAGKELKNSRVDAERREALVDGQYPIAIILSCSDSRVPPEYIFDQGLGDLFVVRVAGNIAAPSQIGSIEYAAGNLGTRLVVVLGHTRCGAVSATVSALEDPAAQFSPAIDSIVKRIRPCVEALCRTDPKPDHDDLLRKAVRANVDATVNILQTESAILEKLAREDGLLILGAVYALETGEVEFITEAQE